METFVGIDIHRKFSHVCVQNQQGKPVAEKRLYHDDLDALRSFFASLEGNVHATMEATMGWMWLADELQDLGLDVHLAHQKHVKAISQARLKTDSVDAKTLAHLLRTGFLPEAYLPPPDVREARMRLRYRMALVHMKIRVKNAIHAILVRYNVINPHTDLFGRAGRAMLSALDLPAAGRACLEGWLEMLEFLEKRIVCAEAALYAGFSDDPRVRLLMSIPGIGKIIAHLILAEIGDISNFSRPKKLAAYAGLAPRVRQSADSFRTGHIGGGRKYLQWGLVEAARCASWKDPWLAAFYQRKKAQKGSAKAIVAVARKLCTIVFHVLKDQRPYHPGRMGFAGSARRTRGGRQAARL